MSREEESCLAGCVLIVVGVLLLGSLWFSAAQKAAAYERVTGRRVSAWDAYWLDLKVHEGPR